MDLLQIASVAMVFINNYNTKILYITIFLSVKILEKRCSVNA